MKVLSFLLALALAGTSYADPFADPQMESKARALFVEIMSPFCPGRSLNDCPSSKAHELKDEIRSELQSGQDPQVILEHVFEKFGDEYRAIPKQSGFGLTTWLVPLSFLVLGAGVLFLKTRRQKGVGNISTSDIIVDERVERELRENLE